MYYLIQEQQHSISSLLNLYDPQHLQKEPVESYISSWDFSQDRTRGLSWQEKGFGFFVQQ